MLREAYWLFRLEGRTLIHLFGSSHEALPMAEFPDFLRRDSDSLENVWCRSRPSQYKGWSPDNLTF